MGLRDVDGVRGDFNGSNLRNVTAFVTAPSSAIHRWQFNDDSDTTTATDSEDTNDGTIQGASYNTTSVKEGSASLTFDGTDDYVDIGAPNNGITNNNFSISFVCKPDNSSNEGWVYGQFNTDGKIIFGQGPSTGDITISNSNFGMQINRSSWSAVKSSTSITGGNWYHVVGTYNDSSGMELYVNGSSEDTDGTTGSFDTDSRGQDIGRDPRSGGAEFDGVLDDVIICNAELTSTEVSDLYNQYNI